MVCISLLVFGGGRGHVGSRLNRFHVERETRSTPKTTQNPNTQMSKNHIFLIQPSQACVWEYLGIFSPDIKFERWFFANITSFCWIFETFQQTFNARKIISISLFRLVYYFLREIVLSEAMFSNFNVSAKTKKHSFLFQGN